MNRIKRIAAILTVFACFTAFSQTAFSQELPEWLKNLKISGDLGLRTEYINDKRQAENFDRVRNRARIRLGLNTTVTDKMQGFFGIETSGTNPTSGWVDFNDFQNQPLYIAHAYMVYKFSDHLAVSGGKIKGPETFWRPTQLVWRNDVNPYGVSANVKAKLGTNLNFFLNGGVFALTQYYDYQTGIDIPMNAIAAAQPGIEYKKNKFSAKGAFTVQQFSLTNHDRHGAGSWIKEYNSFTLLNPAVEIGWSNLIGPYGAQFTGEYSRNINDVSGGHSVQGYLLQAGFGNDKIDRFKAWQVKAAYRRLEQNAIPYGFGNTDAYNAEAGKGWEYFAAFGLLKNLAFNATIFDMTDIDGNLPQMVSKFDVVYKF